MTIGILAIQGDYEAHAKMLDRIGVAHRYVRTSDDLNSLDGIILPGGESTTHLKVMTEEGLFEPLRKFSAAGGPVYGTCAGAILLAPAEARRPPAAVGPKVEVLAEFGGHPILVRQGNILASTFHPELTEDPTIHEYFARMAKDN